ncbi:hypothetical protein MUK70_12870 [Dyadobacter chenwenxiniae]|uniref:Uncharacterized protein n=1 Tax=Dyadobacter chenwenxiniae TaxID=2906456 RepID=A0A9X1PFE8_9BACT|nr:hypothetical protein [Dyadobacter chenwenxiniae]MCF0060137.1 hypothetical protein [Dyadobacter chenwenxiniae]UON85874.1 hypothetical protein MUK70_12870 [Dyadobacter chenwenxiniae]
METLTVRMPDHFRDKFNEQFGIPLLQERTLNMFCAFYETFAYNPTAFKHSMHVVTALQTGLFDIFSQLNGNETFELADNTFWFWGNGSLVINETIDVIQIVYEAIDVIQIVYDCYPLTDYGQCNNPEFTQELTNDRRAIVKLLGNISLAFVDRANLLTCN